MRLVVGVDRPHVAPVGLVPVLDSGDLVLGEVVDLRLAPGNEARDDVATHVVPGVQVLRVGVQRLHQRVAAEDVVAHRGERGVGVVRQTGWVGGLLQELLDLVVRGGVDHPELGGLGPGHPDAGDGAAEAAVDVGVEHLLDVHPVDVVGPEDDDVVGGLVDEQVHRLEDRVGAALVPPGAEPLLRGHRSDVVAQQRGHPPRQGDVLVERVRLVLGQHRDLPHTGVREVRQDEVDQPVGPAERDRGFRPVHRERHQPLSFTAGEDDGENLGTRGCHALNLSLLDSEAGPGITGPGLNLGVSAVGRQDPRAWSHRDHRPDDTSPPSRPGSASTPDCGRADALFVGPTAVQRCRA